MSEGKQTNNKNTVFVLGSNCGPNHFKKCYVCVGLQLLPQVHVHFNKYCVYVGLQLLPQLCSCLHYYFSRITG